MNSPDPTTYDAIKEALLGHRYRPADIPPIDAAGVYALFLAAGAALPDIAVPATGLLYIGMTDSSLDVRNHFAHQHSGFSSPRRTLGGVLKAVLQLRPIPRSAGRFGAQHHALPFWRGWRAAPDRVDAGQSRLRAGQRRA
jgi:hypothetical protein